MCLYNDKHCSDTGHYLGLIVSPPTSSLKAVFSSISSVGGGPGSGDLTLLVEGGSRKDIVLGMKVGPRTTLTLAERKGPYIALLVIKKLVFDHSDGIKKKYLVTFCYVTNYPTMCIWKNNTT